MATNATPATPKPTPENTPLPGGGSYRWSEALAGWVEYYEGEPVAVQAAPVAPQTNPAFTEE